MHYLNEMSTVFHSEDLVEMNQFKDLQLNAKTYKFYENLQDETSTTI